MSLEQMSQLADITKAEVDIPVLHDRRMAYGSFADNSKVSQELKLIIRKHTDNWIGCEPHKEALEMILHKISRIVCGDPTYKDSWTDIAGYAKRVEELL